jgi:NTP pyrophosphatase (non-canonical NTP hydrolase)
MTFSVTLPRWRRSAASVTVTFSNRDVVQQCILLGEEVGELFKAVRKHKKMRAGTTSITGTVDEELADVLIYLCAIANRLGISIDDALRKKGSLE